MCVLGSEYNEQLLFCENLVEMGRTRLTEHIKH